MRTAWLAAVWLATAAMASAQTAPAPTAPSTPAPTPAQAPSAPAPPAPPAPTASPAAPASSSVAPDPLDEMPRAPQRPALTRHQFNRRNWTLTTEIRLHAFQFRALTPRDIRSTSRIVLNSMRGVFPLPDNSSMHDCDTERISGFLRPENRVINNTPRVVEGYQAGTRLMVLDGANIDTQRLTMQFSVPMTSFQTRIDEARAREYTWPRGEWPRPLRSCLEPQLFVEPADPVVRDLVTRWTEGNPRAIRPYDMAKLVAGRVLEHVQPSEGLFESTGRGPLRGSTTGVLVSGFNVRGAAEVARARRGSPLDLASLLTAAYRAAGLPARLVIGFDVRSTLRLRSNPPIVRAWTEFYLYDEATKTGEWIPVDISRQREFSSRMPPLNQRWQYFGHNEEFDFMCPIAYHWHPPTAVINAGPPALWGWVPDPAAISVDQEIRIWAMETPIRGDDPRIREQRRRRP